MVGMNNDEKNQDKHYIIFTDGSSRGNPGPGGWGAIVCGERGVHAKKEPDVTELGGAESPTTNNRMELTGAIKSLVYIPVGSSATLYTDSSYVINGITKWVHGWKKNGWKTKEKKDVSNKDLWQKLDTEISGRHIVWKYVSGHVGVSGNERCDEIATEFADGKKVLLFKGLLRDYGHKNITDISHDYDKMVVKIAHKKATSAHSRAKAYSYVSCVQGVTKIHQTWAECEARVKGVHGVRFKKTLNPADQAEIVQKFRGNL